MWMYWKKQNKCRKSPAKIRREKTSKIGDTENNCKQIISAKIIKLIIESKGMMFTTSNKTITLSNQ